MALVLYVQSERRPLPHIVQMGALLSQRDVGEQVALYVVRASHMVGERRLYLLSEHPLHVLAVAFQVCVNVVMGLSAVIFPVFPLHKFSRVAYYLYVVAQLLALHLLLIP